MNQNAQIDVETHPIKYIERWRGTDWRWEASCIYHLNPRRLLPYHEHVQPLPWLQLRA